MAEGYKSYRIRTKVGQDAPNVVNVQLDQTYDELQILSLKIDQKNSYNLYQSDKGIVVGRVLANGGFGVPNAKVSIFIPTDETMDMDKHIIYPYTSVRDTNNDRVRYNLLPSYKDEACHQNVGTFPTKQYVLDNDDVIEIFDKFWKYTTVTNNSGDYMLYGIPAGTNQTLHVDVDLSDIGFLSQRPTDLAYKGYDINLFESPTKFKKDTNLNSLAQIKSQDIGIYVYPFVGDTTDNPDAIAITRCDIQIDYKFEPTCVFMGSIISDTGSEAIGKNCAGTTDVGKMDKLATGEGRIEMIRKTIDNKVEEFQVKGTRVIDGDGVWCYQIPMNLDYVMTDEMGNLVPTDDPDKGIPTRARVRFRVSLDDVSTDNNLLKRCKFLVPNNPRLDEERFPVFNADEAHEPDYEFGTDTREESYCDLFWNKVYSVKSYIPRIQKNTKITNRKHTGIKMVNHYGNNNPMPYNNLSIKLGFTYRFICVLTKIFINLVGFLNNIITLLGMIPCQLAEFFYSLAKPFNAMRIRIRAFGRTLINICLGCPIGSLFEGIAKIFDGMTPSCIAISSEFCAGEVTHAYTFYPGCGKFLGLTFGLLKCVWNKTKESHDKHQINGEVNPEDRTTAINRDTELYNCVESQLAEDNEATSFNFQNDWINGTIYSPQWFRKITPKKRFFFGLFSRRAKDEWCSADIPSEGLVRIFHPCAVKRAKTGREYQNFNNEDIEPIYMGEDGNGQCTDDCHEKTVVVGLNTGFIRTKQTMLNETVYYLKPVEYDTTLKEVKLLFATDIILLGSLNECDLNGVPQFFKALPSTTFKLPPNMLFTDNYITQKINADGTISDELDQDSVSEMTGSDWGNSNTDICGEPDSGLFYSIGCSTIDMIPKSCINLLRICEYGVSLDETKQIPDYTNVEQDNINYSTLVPDGFISKDELYNDDERSMFATMNGNSLKTKLNTNNGLKEYDFRHIYVDNFDKSLYEVMKRRQKKCNDYTYHLNYNLEEFSRGYYDFRMGAKPYFYDSEGKLPRYENSFYFYFGLKPGETAIDKFNSQFFAECYNEADAVSPIGVEVLANTWCSEILQSPSDVTYANLNGYVKIDLSRIALPCDILIQDKNSDEEFILYDVDDEKIVLANLKSDDTYPGEDEGYVRYCMPITLNDTQVKRCAIMNGSYVMTITDVNNEIITVEFDMKPDYLTFKTEVTNFKVGENVLLERFKNALDPETWNYCDSEACIRHAISSDTTLLTPSPNSSISDVKDVKRQIGGIIVLYDIISSMTNKALSYYVIDIANSDGTFFNKIGFNGTNQPKVLNNSYRIELLTYGSYITNANAPATPGQFVMPPRYFAFGIPKGDDTYTITVREYCDSRLTTATNNVIKKNVIVRNAIPYKLYINDVIDYDVISHWGTGFELQNVKYDAETPDEGKRTNINRNFDVDEFSDNWLHISDYDYHKKVTTVIPTPTGPRTIEYDQWRYNWNELNSYTKALERMQKAIKLARTDDYRFVMPYISPIEIIGNFDPATCNINTDVQGNDRNLVSISKHENDVYKAYKGGNYSNEEGSPNLVYIRKGDLIRFIKDVDAGIKPKFVENSTIDTDFIIIRKKDETYPEGYVELDGILSDETLNDIKDKLDARYTDDMLDVTLDEIYANVGEEPIGERAKYDLNNDGRIDGQDVLYWYNLQDIKVSKEDVVTECDNILEIKQEFIEAMKNTFWLTCPNDYVSISLRTETDEMPVAYYLAYRTEMENEDDPTDNVLEFDERYRNDDDKIERLRYYFNEISRIDEISIPSLTHKDSERFGGGDEIGGTGHDNISLAVDKHSGQETKYSYRYPLFVGVINSLSQTDTQIPDGDTIPTAVKLGVTGDSGTTPYLNRLFGFHIIDKIFETNYMSWSYVSNIPFFRPLKVDNKDGKFASTAGFFTGKIYNGVRDTDEVNETPFVVQKVNKYEIGITTVNKINEEKTDEDAVPTERYVSSWYNRDKYTSADSDRTYDSILNYQIVENAEKKRQYIPLNTTRTMILNLEDHRNCMISEQIYGGMSLELDEESINDCITPAETRFIVNCNNGSGGDILYMVYDVNKDINTTSWKNYPLNYCDVGGGFPYTVQINHDTSYNKNNSYTIYSYNVSKFELAVNAIDNSTMRGDIYDSMGTKVSLHEFLNVESTDADSNAISTNGEFTNPNETGITGSYFVIAVTENNCRVISPVYSFPRIAFDVSELTRTKVSCLFELCEVSEKVKEEEGEEISFKIAKTYQVGFCLNNGTYVPNRWEPISFDVMKPMLSDELYYFKNFPYKIEVKSDAGNESAFAGSATIEVGESAGYTDTDGKMIMKAPFAYFNISYEVWFKLIQIIEYARSRLVNGTEIIFTDYTGLRHRCRPLIDGKDEQIMRITLTSPNQSTYWIRKQGDADAPESERDKGEYVLDVRTKRNTENNNPSTWPIPEYTLPKEYVEGSTTYPMIKGPSSLKLSQWVEQETGATAEPGETIRGLNNVKPSMWMAIWIPRV